MDIVVKVFGSIIVLLSVISFIWLDFVAIMLGLLTLFNTEVNFTTEMSDGFWEKKSSKIVSRIISIFSMGFGIFLILM